MTRVVLASASSGRLRVLRNAGIEPLVVVSGVDEDAVIAALGSHTEPESPESPESPEFIVNALATAKADAVCGVLYSTADCVVIGCDSMLSLDGKLCGKPHSAKVALDQWNSMKGRSGLLYTGHCVIRIVDGTVTYRDAAAVVTTVRFGTPTASDLAAYVASGEPLAVAGAFTLDGLGGWFIDGIDGDPSNVVGLGLSATRGLLGAAGISVCDLWADNPVD